jgi:hypothetical protein
LRIKICQRLDLSLRDEEQVNLIAGRRMLKRNQVRRLAEAFNWDEETHMGEYPADDVNNDWGSKKFSHLVSTFKRLNVETLINKLDLAIIQRLYARYGFDGYTDRCKRVTPAFKNFLYQCANANDFGAGGFCQTTQA